MSVVFSPSNMSAYRQCPLRFYGQSIVKDIEWHASKQKLRGSRIHQLIETAILEGYDADTQWDMQMDTAFTKDCIDRVRAMAKDGAQVKIEADLVVSNKLKPTGWWDDDAYIRARADILVLPPEGNALLVDIKTGRVWDRDAFQLRIEALLVNILYDRPARYEYWYVDSGEVVGGESTDFTDIYQIIRDMTLSQRNGFYPKKSNRFCKSCDYKGTPKCR